MYFYSPKTVCTITKKYYFKKFFRQFPTRFMRANLIKFQTIFKDLLRSFVHMLRPLMYKGMQLEDLGMSAGISLLKWHSLFSTIQYCCNINSKKIWPIQSQTTLNKNWIKVFVFITSIAWVIKEQNEQEEILANTTPELHSVIYNQSFREEALRGKTKVTSRLDEKT